MPPPLYKYQAVSKQSLANLHERTLWCSGPADFNDPFDCNAAVIAATPSEAYLAYHLRKGNIAPSQAAEWLKDGPDAEARVTQEFHKAASDALKNAIDEQVLARGVACLSGSFTDMLMWAHYSDGHRGFCLGFNPALHPFSSARQVRYQSQPTELDPIRLMNGDIQPDELITVFMLTKFDQWRYEQEWRVLRGKAGTALSYAPEGLSDVYLGVKMSERDRGLVKQILVGSPTRIHDMRPARSGFAVEVTDS